MTTFTICVIFFVIVFLIAHKLSRRNQNIFRDRGVEYEKPKIFFGNMLDVFLGRISEERQFEVLYDKFSREKLFGIFILHRPIFVIRDIDLVKRILVENEKKFENEFEFPDEILFKNVNAAAIFNFNQHWLHVDHLNEKFQTNAQNAVCNMISAGRQLEKGVAIETDKLLRFYLAICISANSKNLDNENVNKIYEVTRLIEEDLGSLKCGLKVLIRQIAPRFANFRLFREEVYDFFNVKRGADGDNLNNNSGVDVVQFVQFSGGFQSNLKLLHSCFNELLSSKELRTELTQEFDSVMPEINSNFQFFSHKFLNRFEKLNNFVREILRRHTPVPFILRKCSQDCLVTTKDKELYKFVKGDFIHVPLNLIQNDKKYIKNSKVFETKNLTRSSVSESFMPFGVGVKKCPAQDLVLFQTKFLIFLILSKFSIEKSDEFIILKERNQ